MGVAHQAGLFPEVNFIGAEPFRNGVAKLLALPACSAIAITGGCSLLQVPEAVLQAAAATVHAVLYSEVLAARGVVAFGFPVAICFALFRLPRL